MTETAARFVARVTGAPRPQGVIFIQASAEAAAQGCAFCTGPMAPGDPCVPVESLQVSFTDQEKLTPSPVICESCKKLTPQVWLQKYATGIATEEGIFSFRKFADIAYWVANPPSTPYVMVVTTAQMQHVYWPAALSLPGDVGQLCLGGINHLVRYPKLRAAWHLSLAFRERLEQAQKAAPTKSARSALPNPHGLLVGSIDDLHSSECSPYATAEERAALNGLTPGERWLLFRIQSQNPQNLTRSALLFHKG